jgi:peroxiredoxin
MSRRTSKTVFSALSLVLLVSTGLVAITSGRHGLRNADAPVPDVAHSAESRLLGRRIENFVLRDAQGQPRSLDEFSEHRLIVAAFLGVECPLAKLYARRLEQLRQEFGGRGVAFLALDANAQDSLGEIAAFGQTHELGFPILKDQGHHVADRFGAERTPEVFVLDESRTIRYHGRIDDQYAIGVRRSGPSRRDLAVALEELLEGRAVSVPVAASSGCRIGRSPAVAATEAPTYGSQIAPLLRRRCVGCHQAGQPAPFALTDYHQVVGWAPMIREVVHSGRMPPWFADPRHGRFANDARLSEDEKQLLTRWIDEGCPRGEHLEPSDPELTDPEPPDSQPAAGWRIGTPDQVIFIADEPFRVPADGQVDYQYYLVDPGFIEDKYVQAVEVRPGAPAVVHHALASIVREGEERSGFGTAGVLMNYAPGMQPTVLPPGTAIHVPAGARFLFQMHYTPNGTEHADRTRLGMVLADPRTVKHLITGGAVANPAIQIPPGAANHRETAEHVFEEDVLLTSLSPHMHLRGKSFRFEAAYPDGSRETLLDVPRYDYNWQLHYFLAEPKPLPAGTRLRCIAHYDNSAANPANPDPAQTVRWGEQTRDEMLIGFYSLVSGE